MQRQPSTTVITETAFNALKKDIPQNIRDKVIDYHSFENTLVRIKALRDRTDKNLIKAMLESKHPLFGIEHSNGGLITFPGGIPLVGDGGLVMGAIGVSGSTVENDHEVAQAGVKALNS